ncbi:MAG: hypothetical protein ABSE51_05175 [Terracidiphilus sp.]|jgi:hypothetical protein
MNVDAIYAWCILAGFIPFLAIVLILVHYCFWRLRLREISRPRRKRSRLYSFALALGMAFLQVMRLFYPSSVACILKVQEDEDADEDEDGDPEDLKKQLDRQLKRIRRGEPVERLVLRL